MERKSLGFIQRFHLVKSFEKSLSKAKLGRPLIGKKWLTVQTQKRTTDNFCWVISGILRGKLAGLPKPDDWNSFPDGKKRQFDPFGQNKGSGSEFLFTFSAKKHNWREFFASALKHKMCYFRNVFSIAWKVKDKLQTSTLRKRQNYSCDFFFFFLIESNAIRLIKNPLSSGASLWDWNLGKSRARKKFSWFPAWKLWSPHYKVVFQNGSETLSSLPHIFNPPLSTLLSEGDPLFALFRLAFLPSS